MFEPTLIIECDEAWKDIYSSARILNQFAREALGEEAIEHVEKRLPGHFERSAHSKYGYAQRSRKYIGIKLRQFKTGTDLVRKGDARREVGQERKAVTFRGAAFSGSQGLEARIKLRWPHPQNRREGARKDGLPKVTAQQMSRELTALTPEEKQQITDGFGRRMLMKLNIRKRYGPKVRFYSSK